MRLKTTKNTTTPMSKFTICVPRVNETTTRYTLFESFRKLFIGRILRIDIVTNPKTNNRRAFIHYKYTYDTPQSSDIQNILNDGGYINVVYEFPNYWRCYKSTTH